MQYGWMRKFKANRPLARLEKRDELPKQRQEGVVPSQRMGLIRIYSTYIDWIDASYADRGMFNTALASVATFVFGLWRVYIEVWCSRCWYRNAGKYAGTTRTVYANLKTGLAAFNEALYGLQIEFEWDHDWWNIDNFLGKDGLSVQVVMPGYGEDSEYAYALQVRSIPSNHWVTLNNRYSVFSPDPTLKPHRQQAYMSAVRPGQKLIPPGEVMEVTDPISVTFEKGVAVLRGKLAVNPTYLDHARLKFEYWPDAARRSQLMMTPGFNGVDFREVHA